MLRKRNDSVKPGKGIDGDLGEDYSKAYNDSYRGNYFAPGFPGGVRGGSEGGHGYEHSQPGAYTDNSPELNDVRDFQFTAGVRDITDLVEQNQRPGGDDNTDFDTTGPIRAGVNRSQSEGDKDVRRGRKS